MTRAAIHPELLIWARERAGKGIEDLEHRFPKLVLWESGEAQPTLKQVQAFAHAVHVPVGYLFLPQPPVETLPIPDFRTVDGRAVRRPSPDLIDMVHACQERQGWYKDFAAATRQPGAAFVGSAGLRDSPVAVAARMAETLNFDLAARAASRTWEDALRQFIAQADSIGVLVMVSGVVLSNNTRRLDPDEFRGFALADDRAPLIFINGADSKSAQMFTLAHELAHLWLGATAISDASAAPGHGYRREEVWCNAVAAELLVPLATLRTDLVDDEPVEHALGRLTRRYKVSSLVILRRLLDAGWLDRAAFDRAWAAERARLQAIAERGGGGGDFYRTTLSRVSRRFARALVESTLEGQTLYRDAFRMLGVAKTETFNHLGHEVGGAGLTRYLLDANVFIQAKNLHYGFDFCPAFWEWMIAQNAAGTVASIEKVSDELVGGADELADWAGAQGQAFFLPPDDRVLPALAAVSAWATGNDYEPAAISTFLQVADYWLVAHALAHEWVVVTHEVPAATVRKIKIPNACIALGVPCISPYEMLRRSRARFVLDGAR